MTVPFVSRISYPPPSARKFLVGLALLGLTLSACTKVSYVNPKLTPVGEIIEESANFFVFGLVGDVVISANEHCPNGVAKVQSRFTVVDSLLKTFTIGIYTPRTYQITCGKGVAQ